MSDQNRPWGLDWRSKPRFVQATAAFGLFTDLILYGIVVPLLPSMLRDRLFIPEAEIQVYTSSLLAAYAGATVLFSIPAGWIADMIGSCRLTFLMSLSLLFVSTSLLALGNSFSILLIARVLQGMSTAVVWTVGFALIQDTAGPGEMGQVIGTIFSVITFGALIAPVSGGMLYEKAGPIAVFGVAMGLLVVDFIMRLLCIDRKTLAKHMTSQADGCTSQTNLPEPADPADAEPCENDSLLPKDDGERYKIHRDYGALVRAMPILCCFRERRLLGAMLLSFVQAVVLGVFDATLPTEAESLFHFSSGKIGLLFVALFLPYLAFSQFAGMAVDRYGTKAVATLGYGILSPCLVLLGLPSQESVTGDGKIILFCIILALNGLGLAMVGSPGLVEASDVIQKFEVFNPGLFGENGPYAQLYSFNSLFLFAGLAVGPLIGGMLRTTFGYATMVIVLGIISGATALLSFFIIGDTTGQGSTKISTVSGT